MGIGKKNTVTNRQTEKEKLSRREKRREKERETDSKLNGRVWECKICEEKVKERIVQNVTRERTIVN